MEEIKSRILIKHVQGATIAYLYNRESFDLLNVEKNEDGDYQFVEIGQIIEYDGAKYKVENINFRMDKEMHDMNHGYGINMYSPTDPTDFNSQIGIFVDNVE